MSLEQPACVEKASQDHTLSLQSRSWFGGSISHIHKNIYIYVEQKHHSCKVFVLQFGEDGERERVCSLVSHLASARAPANLTIPTQHLLPAMNQIIGPTNKHSLSVSNKHSRSLTMRPYAHFHCDAAFSFAVAAVAAKAKPNRLIYINI